VGNTTVRLDSHAAATLRYIRSSMEGAVLLAVPGSAGIVLGAIGLLAMALCLAPGLSKYWLGIWLGAALIGAVAGSILIVRESSLRDLRLAGTPLLKFALYLSPSLGAGLVMTAVHWYGGNLHAIPGTWLLLYGCALVTASAATTRVIATLGALYILFGLAALLLADDLQIWILGAGFGGLHIVFGFLIRRMSHGREA
jgi:Na+/melibiose symporter-like transporter